MATETTETWRFDLEAALRSPASVFAEPADVVDHPTLSLEAKSRLLEQWERDARGLAVAEDEGMSGGEDSMLGRVRSAMRKLEVPLPTAAKGATKFGA